MRAVTTGGRESLEHELIFAALDDFVRKHELTEVAHGGQKMWMPLTQRWRGADYWVDQWANDRGVPCQEFPVSEEEWRRLARAAGPVRNRRMIDTFQPDAVIAFPGGAGTADCVTYATERGYKVFQVTKTSTGLPDVQEITPSKLF